MPNWCRNLVIVGDERKMAALVKAHCPVNEESGLPEMDFETIKKMPEELGIEYGSRSHDGLRLYLTRLDPEVDYWGGEGDKMGRGEFHALLESLMNHQLWHDDLKRLAPAELSDLVQTYGRELPKVEDLGKRQIDNARKYGAMNWYEWSVKNWGTKWNACNTVVNGSEMTFDTAWSPAIPAVFEMSRLHPEIAIALLFADEETGYGVGFVLMKGGRIDQQGSFPDGSVDAYKLSFKVWGNGDEYRFDKKQDTYVRRSEL